MEHEGETKGNEQQVAYVRDYFVKGEAELPEDHDSILARMDGRLTLSASTEEPKVFYDKAGMEERASKLNGGCAVQAPGWEEIRGLRDEESVTTWIINKLLNVCDELILKWLNFVKDVVDSEGVPLDRRVFIMDGCDELITEWLNCIVGTVDSEDPPLDMSQEIMQQNKIFRVIKTNLAMKYLEMPAEIAEQEDDYKMFYEQLVKCMKLEIAELLRFGTFTSGDEQISFKEHVDRMKEGQNDNHHMTRESIAVVFPSSVWEYLHKKGP